MASTMSGLLFDCCINKKVSEQSLHNFSVENNSLGQEEKVVNMRNNLDGGIKRFYRPFSSFVSHH